MNSPVLRVVALFVFVAILGSWAAAPIPNESTVEPGSSAPATAPPKAAVDQLIPRLLDEDRQLRGIPFAEVILDTTGKHVLAVDAKNETDQRVIKQISAACDEMLKRLNAPDSVIQNIGRINEVSSHFEDMLRDLLNTTRGLSCDFPHTTADRVLRSGYPDLRIVDLASKRVFLSGPKTICEGKPRQQFPDILFRAKNRD